MGKFRPPHDLDTEKALLSMMLTYNKTIPEVAGLLRSSDFYSGLHQTLFEVIAGVDYPRETIDPVTLYDRLKTKGLTGGEKDLVTGRQIAEVSEFYSTTALLPEYVKIIKRDSTKREVHRVALELQKLSMDPTEDVEELIEKAHRSVDELNYDVGTESSEIREVLTQVFESLQSDECVQKVLPTGFTCLDELLDGGFRPGDLCVVAARPSGGKSTFALNIASHMTSLGFAAAFFALEMTKAEVASRELCSVSEVSYHKIRRRSLSSDEIAKVIDAAAKIKTYDLRIQDRSDLTVKQIYSEARKFKRLDVIVVDYLQLLTPSDPKAIRAEQVADVSRKLKGLAKTLGVPVLALSQLNRASEQRENNRPRMSELRESGAIEQDADQVILMWRSAENENQTMFALEKQRNGATGEFKLNYEKQFMRFAEPLATDSFSEESRSRNNERYPAPF